MGRTRQDTGESESGDELERGRAAHARRAWSDAYALLAQADEQSELGGEDLQKLALAANLSGHDSDALRLNERLYHLQADSDPPRHAAHTAFWIGFRLLSIGEAGPSSAWLQRAQRLAEREPGGCAVQGYLLIPVAIRLLAGSEIDAGFETAGKIIEFGERFGDPNLLAFGRLLRGRGYVRMGQIEPGLALSDEAMLAATSGELSPIVTGLVYCSVIATFQQVYAVRRAREWTAALTSFCETQPQLVPFAGTCLVYRAELMQFGGAWHEASQEMQRCAQRPRAAGDGSVPEALYQHAEIQRLRGELDPAEASYRKASELGREPQPGLALLRLAQGQIDAAQSAIRRVLGATPDALRRVQLLPAYVEIMLAAGDLDAAREACAELEQTAQRYQTDVLAALAGHARGALQLRAGDAQAALAPLRAAFAIWQQLEAPYLAARMRVLLGQACAALGDRDGAELERSAARSVFEKLGAARDLAALDAAGDRAKAAPSVHNLSARELEVLRLLATGKTNKAMAQALFLSEKTIDRHVSNIFAKLDVRTRAAATAYAYEHGLL